MPNDKTLDDKALTAAAGVYYVAFKLCSRGYAVALAPPGSAVVDLLATRPSAGYAVELQVKTMREALGRKKDPYWKWWLSQRNLNEHRASLFLCFVDLRPAGSQNPDVYIVPSTDLSRIIQEENPHPGWFTLSGEGATKYKNNWNLINDYVESRPAIEG